MKNPARTADHLARLSQRGDDLRSELARLLPAPASFVWEVGCGHGHFLTAFAQAHPGQLCIGIDVILERIERARRKRNRAHLEHLHFVRAEARLFLESLPAGAAFKAVYVLFPDPWPKRRHHKHRLMQADFLGLVADRAGEGARLYFRTDHEPYFREVEAAVRQHPRWEVVEENWPFEMQTVFQERAQSFRSLVAARV